MVLPAAPSATSNLNEVATQDTGASVVKDDRAKCLVCGFLAAHIVGKAPRAADAGLGDGEFRTFGEGAEAAVEITDLAGASILAFFKDIVGLVGAVGG